LGNFKDDSDDFNTAIHIIDVFDILSALKMQKCIIIMHFCIE